MRLLIIAGLLLATSYFAGTITWMIQMVSAALP